MGLSAEEEFAWFFRGEYARVVGAAYVVAQDLGAAEDAAQEAFAQLFRHWKKVSRYEKPDAWVRRVAIRAAAKAQRRDRRRRHLHEGLELPATRVEGDPDLMRAIAKLPTAQRAAVMLFYLEDRPVDEVAEILDCSGSTARVHLHKARKRLAKELGEEVSADVT